MWEHDLVFLGRMKLTSKIFVLGKTFFIVTPSEEKLFIFLSIDELFLRICISPLLHRNSRWFRFVLRYACMQDFKITIMFKTGSVKSHNHIGKSGFYSLMFSMGYFFPNTLKICTRTIFIIVSQVMLITWTQCLIRSLNGPWECSGGKQVWSVGSDSVRFATRDSSMSACQGVVGL